MTTNFGVRRTHGAFMLALGIAALIVSAGGTAGADHENDHVNADAPITEIRFSVPVALPSVGGLTGPFRICIGTTCVDQTSLPSGQSEGTLHVLLVGDSLDTVNLDANQAACPSPQVGAGLSIVSSADAIESVRAEFVPSQAGSAPIGVPSQNPPGAIRNVNVLVCTSDS